MSNIELMHYASRMLTLDRTREYVHPIPCLYGKPKGFWVSVTGEDDWPSWCRSEEFAIERLEVGHVVSLAQDANVLHISDLTALIVWAVYGVIRLRERKLRRDAERLQIMEAQR